VRRGVPIRACAGQEERAGTTIVVLPGQIRLQD